MQAIGLGAADCRSPTDREGNMGALGNCISETSFLLTQAILVTPDVEILRVKLTYLDPGSGSYLLQLLIAGLLGALFMLRGYWGRVKNSILRLFGKAPADAEESDDRG
jgi:hypothetical protein